MASNNQQDARKKYYPVDLSTVNAVVETGAANKRIINTMLNGRKPSGKDIRRIKKKNPELGRVLDTKDGILRY